MLLERSRHLHRLEDLLTCHPIVGLLGARQVGKTTLARQLVVRSSGPTTIFDLETLLVWHAWTTLCWRCKDWKASWSLTKYSGAQNFFPCSACPLIVHRIQCSFWCSIVLPQPCYTNPLNRLQVASITTSWEALRWTRWGWKPETSSGYAVAGW
jgi:hypothetical protein